MLSAAVLSSTILIGACGNDNAPEGSQATSSQAPSGAVASNPPVDSAEAAVARLRRWVNLGSPTLVTAYDPKTVRFLGTETILRALASVKGGVPPNAKLSEEKTRLGTLVTVETKQPGSPTSFTGYLLTKKDDQWLVGYDGLLASQLAATVQTRRQSKINPKAKEPSPEAIASGQAAMLRFVKLFAPEPRTGQFRIE